MSYETTDHESLAQLLRAEREQLILAWEKLENEQRKLASTTGMPLRPPDQGASPSGVIPVVGQQLSKEKAAVQLTSQTEAPVNTKSLASNTFRFLQREFDNRQ